MADAPSSLTLLGSPQRAPVDALECFDAPEHVTEVRFACAELTSMCPITGQPDFATVEILYRPRRRCVESKSLKLYLWSFRERQAFAEALAAEIAGEVQRAAEPEWVRVTLAQNVRGGIALTATAERRADG